MSLNFPAPLLLSLLKQCMLSWKMVVGIANRNLIIGPNFRHIYGQTTMLIGRQILNDPLAKATIIVDVKMSQDDLNAYWDEPIDILLNGFSKYYSSDNVRIFRIGGVIIDD